jgi:hypothetical protein
MSLVAQAWRLRELARQAIVEGDPERCRALTSQAQQICHTSDGRRLEVLNEWLTEHRPSPEGSFDAPEILEGTIDSAIGAFDQMTLFAWPFEDP